MLETFVGECPKGMEGCHNDGNPQNNNLDNLRWDSKKNNQRDRIKHGTFGGNNGQKNGLSKLKDSDIIVIYNAYHDGAYSQKELAELFNVAPPQISNIVNRKSWKHIWR